MDHRKTFVGVDLSLLVLDNYFEGAGYSTGGTYSLTICTPVAPFYFDNSNNLGNQNQNITSAHINTQPTPIAFCAVY
jgi:hypothetical protein